jgi:hypothetical protein
MKNLNFLNLGKQLTRSEMKFIIGGEDPIGGGGGSGCGHQCPTVDAACVINGRNGVCKILSCDSTDTRLCDAPL